MSLDVYLRVVKPVDIYNGNITHNLGNMAREAGVYEALWRPEEIGITHAHQLIPILQKGIEELESKPEHYRQFNPPNGWGSYEGLIRFMREYLEACGNEPDATVTVWR